jgi:hypothetical protein
MHVIGSADAACLTFQTAPRSRESTRAVSEYDSDVPLAGVSTLLLLATVYWWPAGHAEAPRKSGQVLPPSLGQLRVAQAVPASSRFRYDEASGKCLDADGREGYNRGSREALEGNQDTECANFSGQGINLTYLRLKNANLRGANFARARWYLGSIEDSDLTGANLSDASGQMDYGGSRLRDANLSRAGLEWADLRDTDLSGADLRGARFSPRTQLPFDRDEALRRGMVFVPSP